MKLAIELLEWKAHINKNYITNCHDLIKFNCYGKSDTKENIQNRIRIHRKDIKEIRKAIKVLKEVKG